MTGSPLHLSSARRPADRRVLAVLTLLLVLVFALGARGLDRDGIWFDEWWSLFNAGAPVFGGPLSPGDIWTRVYTDDIWQSPGYPLALAAWGAAAGWTEAGGRLFSLMAGMLAAAFVVRLALDWSRDRAVGIAALLAFGASAWTVYYLHEMRVYTLIMAFTAATVLVYERWMRGGGTAHLLALAVGAAGLLYAHYYAAAVLLVLSIVHIGRYAETVAARGRFLVPDRRWWGVVAALGAASLAFAPWVLAVVRTLSRLEDPARYVAPDVPLLALTFAHDLVVAFSSDALALGLLVFAFSLADRRAVAVWRYIVGLYLVMLVFYVVAQERALSLYELRYSIMILPMLGVAAGFGLAALARRGVPLVLTGALWLAGSLLVGDTLAYGRLIQVTPPRDTRALADTLRPHLGAGDLIIDQEGEQMPSILQQHPLRYYLEAAQADLAILEAYTLEGDMLRFARRFDRITAGAPLVWATYSREWPSEAWGLFRYLLATRGYQHCATLADTPSLLAGGWFRFESDRGSSEPPRRHRPPGPRSPRLNSDARTPEVSIFTRTLAASAVFARPAPTVQVWLGFRYGRGFAFERYSAAVHLLDARGALVAQSDRGLARPTGPGSCQLHTLSLAGLPPGTYTLNVFVYDWQTGERLAISTPTLAPITIR
jgi:hypothetical protein